MIRPSIIAGGILLFSALLSASTPTTTTLTSVTPPAPVFGQAVTMVATVTPAAAGGFVSFMDRGVLVGTGAVNGSGIAQATTLTLSPGPHSLVAVYGGNTVGGYLPSQSVARYHVVTAASGAGFAPVVNYTAGQTPVSVAVGDFNGDGKADLVVANQGNDVGVLLGNGNGTFHPVATYTVGTMPNSVAVGDFNGDGKMDLAVVNLGGNVSVLLGNGDGTFQPAMNYAAGTNPVYVAVGDFDGDGKADLAVVVFDGVSTLLGNGDGSFQAPVFHAAGNIPQSAAVGDFNGDGKADLVVANSSASNVYVLIGNGDGSFQAAASYAAGTGPFFVAVGDFNGDGNKDLAVANDGGNNVNVLIGNGDGSFRAPVPYSAGTNPDALAVGDFNGDGIADLVVSSLNSNNVSVLLGNGNGTFQSAMSYSVGPSLTDPGSVAVGDFNGDGIADVVVADGGTLGTVINKVGVLLGVAPSPTTTSLMSSANPSTFGHTVTLTATVTPSNAPGSVEFLDGTTVVDVKALTSGQAQITTSLLPSGPNSVRARYAGVPGVWQPSQSSVVHQVVNPVAATGYSALVNYGTGIWPVSVVAADFNGDGKVDLAAANNDSSNVSVLLGNGNGTFQTAMNFGAGSGPIFLATGDFNGDGKPDLVVVNLNAGNISVLIGNGDGTMQPPVNYTTGPGPWSVAVADYNGDGKADLAVANAGSNNVSVLLGNGDGTFQAAVNYAAGSGAWAVAAGDFNGDGNADLVVGNHNTNTLSVLLGNGNGTFQAAVTYTVGANPYSVAVGDFDGDGKSDLAVANSGSNNVSVLLGNGDGTFQAAANYGAGSTPENVAVGDLNGDGKQDLVVSNFGSGNVSVLLGNGNGIFQAAVNYTTGSGPSSAAVADFNADGAADIAEANFNSNNISILLGQPSVVAPLQFYPVPPCRIADTRTSQPFTGAFGPPALAAYVSRNFPILSSGCSIPSTAQAYSLNFTAVPSGPLSFLSAWQAGGSYPGVSTLNSTDGSVIANAAIVPAGTSGGITVVAGNPTDLVIDINGYFAPPGASSLEFFPLTPCRIADTRTTQPFTGAFGPPSLSAYVTRDFPISTSPCVSGSEQAYSLNITVVPPGPEGFLSVWPVGQSYPGVSTLNSPDGNVIANAAIVPAGTGGDINVVVGNPTDVVIDIDGKFAAPGVGGLQFYAVTPCRVADTRTSQPFTGAFGPPSLAAYTNRNFPIQSSTCGIPAGAQAYALNLTAVPQGPLGFLSTWPAGQSYPGVSTLNSPSGEVIANAAIVPAGAGGAITVVTGNPTDLIIDIVGYFAP